MMDDDPRAALVTLMAGIPGETLSSLSRLIGRNDAYLQQFIRRGSPRVLAERDRQRLAAYFGVDEARLGGPSRTSTDVVPVPRLDIAAAAGSGTRVDDEQRRGTLALDARFVAALGIRGPLSTVRAEGDSMAPDIVDGDELLVDTGQRRVASRGGVFVLRRDGLVLVKRVAREGSRWRITSDNREAPSIGLVDPAEVEVLGRVVWLGRTL